MRAELDSTDRRLLHALQCDGRKSVSALATELSLSRPTVQARLERLVHDGVIQHFTASVDPARVGLGVTAMITVTLGHADWPAFKAELTDIEGVEYSALVAGGFDAMLLVRVTDIDTLRTIVLTRLHAIPEVQRTETFLVLEEFIRRPFVLPPVDPAGQR